MGNTGGNGLPVEDEIERFLNDRYPGAKVVERDYDDGCLELTILHENLRKEVLFDGRNNWLRTEWELHRLPQIFWMRCSRLAIPSTTTNLNASKLPAGWWYEFEARKDRREYDCVWIRTEISRPTKIDGSARQLLNFCMANIHLIKINDIMKKMILAVALLLTGIVSAQADGREKPITIDNLPKAAQEFLAT